MTDLPSLIDDCFVKIAERFVIILLTGNSENNKRKRGTGGACPSVPLCTVLIITLRRMDARWKLSEYLYFICQLWDFFNFLRRKTTDFFPCNLFQLRYLHGKYRVLFSLHPRGHLVQTSGFLRRVHTCRIVEVQGMEQFMAWTFLNRLWIR